MSDLVTKDIQGSPWREYRWPVDGKEQCVRINSPQKLIYRPGGTTHRVVDAADEVYIVPAVGYFGCYIVYSPADPKTPARF